MMLDRIEILVEERSIAEVLRGVLPQILPKGWTIDHNCFVRPHEGKQDLQRSLPRKISAACKRDIKIGFIVLQDQDSSDCHSLKKKLVKICEEAQNGTAKVPFRVRIVCHELESWYMGDLDAVEKVFPRFHASKYKNKRLFRNPDNCVNPKQELKRVLGDFSQMTTAYEMAQNMNVENNNSHSFQCFVNTVVMMTSSN